MASASAACRIVVAARTRRTIGCDRPAQGNPRDATEVERLTRSCAERQIAWGRQNPGFARKIASCSCRPCRDPEVPRAARSARQARLMWIPRYGRCARKAQAAATPESTADAGALPTSGETVRQRGTSIAREIVAILRGDDHVDVGGAARASCHSRDQAAAAKRSSRMSTIVAIAAGIAHQRALNRGLLVYLASVCLGARLKYSW